MDHESPRPHNANTYQPYTAFEILKDFLYKMEYTTPDIEPKNQELEDFMRAEMLARGIQCPQLERTIHLAASMIEFAYGGCTPEQKRNIALFNWYIIYIDDNACKSKDVERFAVFSQRFLRGLPQLDPVLEVLSNHLLKLCDQYETPVANSIISTTLEYVNFTCIEPALEVVPLVRGASRFPWFLRDRTGLSVTYALMMFTKTREVNIMNCFQALADMNFWISISNDLMSFHKEELVGETANYVHNCAYMEGKAPMQVLSEFEQELRVARKSIYDALEPSPGAVEAWATFERGYVAWHLNQDRYKLQDLFL